MAGSILRVRPRHRIFRKKISFTMPIRAAPVLSGLTTDNVQFSLAATANRGRVRADLTRGPCGISSLARFETAPHQMFHDSYLAYCEGISGVLQAWFISGKFFLKKPMLGDLSQR